MARGDLPGIEQDVTVEPVHGPSVAGEMRGMGAPFAALADLGQKFQGIAEKHGIEDASQAGGAAVTRDPDGNLQIEGGLHDGAFPTGAAYNHAAVTAYAAQSTGDRRVAFQKMADQYQSDPEAFEKNAKAWVTAQVAKAPGLVQNDLRNDGLAEASQFSAGLVAQKRRTDIKVQYGDVQSNITSGWNDLFALAKQGGTATDAFNSARAQVMNQYEALKNPVFRLGPDEIKNEIAERSSMAEAYALSGHAIRTAHVDGAAAGIKELSVFDDPKYNLSEENRQHFKSQTRSEIMEADAANKSLAEDQKRTVAGTLDDARSAAAAKGKWSDIVTPDAIKAAYGPQAYRIIADLDARTNLYSFNKQLSNATPTQTASLLASLDPSKHPGTQGGFDSFYSRYLAGVEGGYTASDGNGQPAAYGINQGANPDINVKDLTPDKAKALLHDRYWQPSGADAMPADLAAVHGDTAVNMGLAASKDLLAKSGGDVSKYLALREQRYRDIAANDPSKAASLPGWLDRNSALKAFADSVSGQPGSAGFKEQEAVFAAATEAAKRRQQALTTDPSGYVQATRPDIATLAQGDKRSIQQVTRDSIALQRQVGVAAPQVLSKAQVGNLVQQFSNPPDPSRRGQFMSQEIGTLENSYGQYFPQVMQELIKGVLPNEAYALSLTRDDPGVSLRMSKAIDQKPAIDKLMEGTSDKRDIDTAVTGALADMGRTTASQGDGAGAMARIASATRLYAYQLVQEGVPAGRAAEQAAKDVVTSRYTVQDTYRVPAGINASAVAAGAQASITGMKDSDFAARGTLASPNADPATKVQMTGSVARSKAIWVTTPGEDGLVLVWPQELGFAPVRDAKNQPIRKSWAQLTATGGGADQRSLDSALGQALGQ